MADPVTLPEAVVKDRGQPAVVRIGQVTSVDPFTVSVQGTDFVGVGLLNGASAGVGTTVLMLGQSAVSASGSSWICLGGIAASAAVTTAADIQNTNGTTTSTSYTATLTGGTACGVTFVAPPSGQVLVFNNCAVVNNTATVQSLCTIRVRTGDVVGSGADVWANGDNDAFFHPGTSEMRGAVTTLVTDLTPGDVYNVQQLFRVDSASTGTFGRKMLIVEGK